MFDRQLKHDALQADALKVRPQRIPRKGHVECLPRSERPRKERRTEEGPLLYVYLCTYDYEGV